MRQMGEIALPANLGHVLSHVSGFLSVFLVIAMAHILVQLLWGALHDFNQPINVSATVSPRQITQAQAPDIDLSRLLGSKLFGQYVPTPITTPKVEATKAPKTTLRLDLQGVFHGLSGVNSTAIIAQQGKTGELYRVGEQVSAGVTLQSVLSDRVILSRRGGALEALYFDDDSKLEGVKSVSASSGSGVNPANRNSDKKSRLSDAKSNLGKMISSGRSHSPEQIVQAITTDLESNPQAALQELGLESVGAGQGYSVGRGASRDLLRAMGLRSGDKVISINGWPLGDPGSDASQIKSALGGEKIRVEIQRGSRRFTVNLDVP